MIGGDPLQRGQVNPKYPESLAWRQFPHSWSPAGGLRQFPFVPDSWQTWASQLQPHAYDTIKYLTYHICYLPSWVYEQFNTFQDERDAAK